MEYNRSAGGVLMPSSKLTMGGVFACEQYRKGELIDQWEDHNLVVNEGLNHILDVQFHGATQITTWYLAPFEGNYTPIATLTAATVTAAATECTAYDEATRVAFDEAAPASQAISNVASKATFTFNATKTIYGMFLVSAAAKSATSGKLFAAARFATSKAVEDDDQLLVSYTFTATSS
jgi:hypothetical protein